MDVRGHQVCTLAAISYIRILAFRLRQPASDIFDLCRLHPLYFLSPDHFRLLRTVLKQRRRQGFHSQEPLSHASSGGNSFSIWYLEDREQA